MALATSADPVESAVLVEWIDATRGNVESTTAHNNRWSASCNDIAEIIDNDHVAIEATNNASPAVSLGSSRQAQHQDQGQQKTNHRSPTFQIKSAADSPYCWTQQAAA